MAHEIEQYADGSAAFISARKDAWHRLGTVVSEAFTAQQAMELAKLGGWNVRTAELRATDVSDDGVTAVDVPDHVASVRTNPVTGATETLGVVGRKWRPIQNEANCDLLDELVDQSGAGFETAGALKGGRQTFVTMKLPEQLTIAGADQVDLYIAALNSHDGSSAFRFLVTPVRIVCANTQNLAINSAQAQFSIRHTAGAESRIEEARQALGLTWRYVEEFEAEAERLINAELSTQQYAKVLDKLYPAPDPGAQAFVRRRHDEAMSTLRGLFTESTNRNIAGSKWAGVQAVAEYVDHYAPVRGADDVETRRAAASLGTDALRTKNRAHKLIAAV